MQNANEEDADSFKKLVIEVLNEVAGNGLDSEMVNATLKAAEIKRFLLTESTSPFIEGIMPEVLMKWAATGKTDILADETRALEEVKQDSEQMIIKKLAENCSMFPEARWRLRFLSLVWLNRSYRSRRTILSNEKPA